MADIKTPITYPAALQSLITDKLNDPNFSYKNWTDPDLEIVRTYIRNYYRRVQHGLCYYCRGPVSLQSASNCHVEHIVPKSKRREFIFEPKNLCVICADCNEIKRQKETEATIEDTLTKGDKAKRYPRSSNAFLIVHPHYDEWDRHIINFGKIYLDLTTKGNFTIGACILNRTLRTFGWEAIVTDEEALRNAAAEWLGTSDKLKASRALQALKRLLLFA